MAHISGKKTTVKYTIDSDGLGAALIINGKDDIKLVIGSLTFHGSDLEKYYDIFQEAKYLMEEHMEKPNADF
jgi:hypothetical protein